MKIQDIPKSGKRGQVVAFKSRYGQVERQHTPPRKRPTAAQLRVRFEFGGASLGWKTLTEEQRGAWRARGKKVRSHPRGGQSGPLTGQNFYTAINRNQALLGLGRIVDPPDRPTFSPNAIGALSITRENGVLALNVSVLKARPGYTLVYASCPYNAGRTYCDKFAYLGLLPAPDGGQSDITELYVKRYGKPPPGSRVIILIVQQLDGWRDNPQRTDAIVPAA